MAGVVWLSACTDAVPEALTTETLTVETPGSAPDIPPSTGTPAEGPRVAPIDPCSFLSLEAVDAALGLLDLPLEERGLFTISGGEACVWEHDDEGDKPEARSVGIMPGSPDDFEQDAELEGVEGNPVTGIAEVAVWFGGIDQGTLSVIQGTELGYLLVRFTLSRPDLDDKARLEIAKGLAGVVLPQFPGVEARQPVVVTFDDEPPDMSNLSFVDNLLAKEEAGEWTLGEGLVATLQLFVGEVDETEVLRHPELLAKEGTGIIAMAYEYLEAGGQADAKTEISRLLDLLVFTNEELEGMAGIGPPTASLFEVAVGAPPDEIGGCSAFFYGYSTLPTGIGPCLEYQSITFDGRLYRVFYPAKSMPAAGWSENHYRWALEAMADTVVAYAPHGTTPAVNLVFSIFPGNALAEALPHAGEPCAVAVYTSMQGTTIGYFKQVIAHELAHCFQEETFTEQNQVGYEVVRWREEGLADYLSNVVYEETNAEWDYLALEELELHTTLFERAYTNSLFFQFLAGKIADAGIVGLVHTLPKSGATVEQENALAGYRNMQAMYHEFAQAMTDASIKDTSTALVPYRPRANKNSISGPVALQSIPLRFGVTRQHLVTEGGKTACLEHDQTSEIRSSWRPGPPGGAVRGTWSSELPNSLKGEAVFVTTATTSNQELTLEVTKVVDDEEDCEEDEREGCLVLECVSGYYRFLFQLPDGLRRILDE